MSSIDDIGVLFLHALPFDARMWEKLMPLAHVPTYAPNLYKFGDTIRAWAVECLKLPMPKQLIIVGCSVGGSCALEIARIAPERTAALVLVSTKAAHRPEPEFLKTACDCVSSKGVGHAWVTYWADQFDKRTTTGRRARAIALEQSTDDLINGLTAFHTRPDRSEFAIATEIPLHFINGAQDKLVNINKTQALARRAKCAKHHVIENCGHYAPMTHAQEFNRLLESVISEVRKARC